MAGGRRNAKSSSFKHHGHSSDDRHSCEMPTHPQVVPPKHIPVPELPPSSDLCFEIDSFGFCFLAMMGQYVILYRSVFWLPYSHNDDALNFYLIDKNVVFVNLIMVGRRLPVSLLKRIFFWLLPPPYHSTCAVCIRVITLVLLFPIMAICFYNLIMTYGGLTIVPLAYPFVIYFAAFGPSTVKFLELKNNPLERNVGTKSKSSVPVKSTSSVSHVCSMSAETIREEVEVLKNDFNARLKQVLFNTLLIVYHAAFLPCYFAKSNLYFHVNSAINHSVFTGLSCFTLYAKHCFPPRYCDVLHRAALHLGRWQRVEIKNVHVPYSIWSESTTWNQGALVKHSKELFKAEGISNAAEPGHSAHSRFYSLFKNPTTPMKCLWIFHLLILLSQMFIMVQSYTWNEIVPIQVLVLMNCRTLYSLTKNFFVIRKIYHEEKLLIAKFNN